MFANSYLGKIDTVMLLRSIIVLVKIHNRADLPVPTLHTRRIPSFSKHIRKYAMPANISLTQVKPVTEVKEINHYATPCAQRSLNVPHNTHYTARR